MLAYEPKQSKKDEPLLQDIDAISRQRTTWGCRIIQGWLKAKRNDASLFRVRRLWKLHGYSSSWKKRWKKLKTGKRLFPKAIEANGIWCMDFSEDRLTTGRRFMTLLVKDEATAYGLGAPVRSSFKGTDVEDCLNDLAQKYGTPNYLRCDNGGQFIAFVVQQWAERHGVQMAHVEPGKPCQNGSAESFVGTYRREVLDVELFGSIAEAAWLTKRWLAMYNNQRQHSRLGYKPPATAYAVKAKEA